MPKYCLCYYTEDSENFDPLIVKQKIVEILLRKDAINLTEPVESTILFETKEDMLDLFANKLRFELKKRLYFYLSTVSESDTDSFSERIEPNTLLGHNFKQLVLNVELLIKLNSTYLKERVF